MLTVIQAPDERLRIQTKPVKKISPELIKLSTLMINLTQTFHDPEGVGLASTQIGREEAIFVALNPQDKFEVFINPKILKFGPKTKVFFEGCLSIPAYFGEVSRPTSVDVEYQDLGGKQIKKKLRGISAWIFQHEMDHLNGKLFMDHILSQKSRLFKCTGKDRADGDVFEEISLKLEI